ATKNTEFTLTNSTLHTSDDMSLTLAAIGTANLTGGAAANTFTVSGWTGTGTMTGAGGSDTIIASKDTDFTLANNTLSSSDGMSQIGRASGRESVTGGAGANMFKVTEGTGEVAT